MKRQTFIALIVMILAASPVYGAPKEKQESQKEEKKIDTLRLSVADCVKLVLEHNLILLDAKLNPQIYGTDISKTRAEFDPTWQGEVSRTQSRKKPSTLFSSAIDKNKETDFNTGIRQKLKTGTQWSLDFDNAHKETNSGFQTLKERYESDLTLTVTQPLLKDFGIEINEMNITIAANDKKISIEELKETLMDRIVLVEKLYWDLVFSLENLEVNRILLQQAQDLLNLNRAQVEAGVLAPIEVLEAEASVASRQEGILVAENKVRDTQDQLLVATNLAERNWDLILLPTEEAKFVKVDVDLDKCISDAHEKRPLFKQKELALKKIGYNLRLAENDRKTSLDIFGNYGINTLGENYGDGWDSRFYSWKAGAEFSIPLGNQAAKADILKQKLKIQQAEYDFRRTKILIEMVVREAYWQMNTDEKRIQTTEVAKKLEKRKLEIEKEKLKLGLSTSHDVLEFQADLAESRRRNIEAIIDYKKSLVELSRRTGRLLENHQITINKLYPDIF